MKTLTDEHRKFIRTHIVNNLREFGESDFDSQFRFFDDDIMCVFVRKGYYALYGNPHRYNWFYYSETNEFALTLSDTELLNWASEHIVNLDKDDVDFWSELDKLTIVT